MRSVLRILLCLLPILSIGQSLPKTIHIDVNDGLIQRGIWGIEEDLDHRIWIGTSGGIQIYDGFSLTTLPEIDGRVLRLQRHDSSIYCITNSSIYKFKTQDFSYTKVRFERPYFYISEFLPQGIAIRDLDNSSELFYNYDLQIDSNHTEEISKTPHFFEFQLSNYFITGGVNGITINDSILMSNTYSTQFVKYNSDRAFVASHKGVIELYIEKGELQVKHHFEDLRIGRLFIDSRKNLWIGTADRGLFMIHKNSLQSSYFPKTHSDGNPISCWGFSTFNDKPYVATEHGVIPVEQDIWEDDEIYQDTKNMACNAIVGAKDFLLIGTRSDGIYRLKNRKLEQVFINTENQLDNIIVQIERTKNGFLAASKYSMIQLDKQGQFVSQRTTDYDEKYAYSMSFYQHLEGVMNPRTTGLIALDSNFNVIKKYTNDSIQVVSMMKPFQGKWWGVSLDAGLLKIENEKLITVPFPDKRLFTLSNCNDNALWISGIKSIYKYTSETVQPFSIQNGFPIKEYNQNSFFKDSLGFLYYGGIDGVQKFHPDSLTFTSYFPSVIIERNGNRLSVDRSINLDFDQSEIALYVYPVSISDQNLFSIEIGIDNKWIKVNQPKQLSYDIPFGSSQIELRITNLVTKNIQTTQFSVQREQPFWKKPWYIMLITLTIVFLIIGFISLIGLVKTKRQNKLAKIRIEEQQKGLSAVIQAQEEERKRIAKDLHDGIVQQLTGLKLGMQKVFSNNETDESNKLIKILDNSAEELRELSHRMMPRSLREVGLIPSLEDMLENSLGNTDIHFQFEYFGIDQRFTENIEIAIYRIAQELVNNVIKHSKADSVNVQLFKVADDVILIIEDNGISIDMSQQKKGIGLMNISSRLETINGKVNFESSPESGTLATVKIPIQ